MAAKLSIEDMQELAASRGGKCLSPEYVNVRAKLEWQCAAGHRWSAVPGSIKNRGHWCPKCGQISRKRTITDLQECAESRNGKLLSEKYTYLKDKYQWQCQDGHIWSASADSVLRGSWCPQCSRGLQERMCRAYFESIFNAPFPTLRPRWLLNEWGNQMELDGYNRSLGLAFEYNGIQHYKQTRFLNQTATAFKRLQASDRTKQQLCKKHGVKLAVIPYSIPTEDLGKFVYSWCIEAGFSVPSDWSPDTVDLSPAYSPAKLDSLRTYAEAQGGSCLSKHYLGTTTKHLWECREGHRWKAIPDSVLNGTWCPTCGGTQRKTIEDAQNLAKTKGGECWSTSYKNNRINLRWRCEKGHEWKAAYSNIAAGSWCPDCGGSKPLTLENMHEYARQNGGKCVSQTYVNAQTKLTWMCSEGHRWEATPNNIQRGEWCRICRDTTLSIEQMRQLAEERGGACLSKSYTNNRALLEWECANGHRWKATAAHIKGGSWCKECMWEGRRRTIEDMREMAAQRGGKCFSTKYVNVTTHLRWQCAEGHQWSAKPNNVQQGKWCRKCAKQKQFELQRQQTLVECNSLAKQSDGQCLSEAYVNNKVPMLWQCARGHQFEMPLTYVKRGSWCPECRKEQSRTIQ